jgi:hydrogenase-4 component B
LLAVPAAIVVLIAPGLCALGAVVALLLQRWPAAARWAGGLLGLTGCLAGLVAALPVLLNGGQLRLELFRSAPFAPVSLRLDGLAAWFVLLISVVGFAVGLAGLGYGRSYVRHGGPRLAAATGLFQASMLFVVLADSAFAFLLAWEVMSLASYALVVHEHEQPGVVQAGYVYLVMTHLGTAFLVTAFLVLFAASGDFGFAGFKTAATTLDPRLRDALFLLGLVGFGTKAGLIPLHVWLPRAHPVAPSHISALMSGVMLKTAIYGLVRLDWDLLGGGPAWWGGLLLVLGLISAVMGVLYALMEHDLKRLLAFHSVENIGIILIGLGAALSLGAFGQPAAAALALGAGLFHALNHALFKALLFLGAGAIQQATGTKDLEHLGGLIRRLPATAVLFLLGAMAISALPPLNGFASEWLTFQSLLALGSAASATWVAAGAVLAGGLLALTGALAAACFVKAFGVAFLGLPRSEQAAGAREAPLALRGGMSLLAAACLLLGLQPGLALWLLGPATTELTGASLAAGQPSWLGRLAGPGGAQVDPTLLLGALLAFGGLALLVGRLLGPTLVRRGPTWACGFALDASMQYGATAFAKPIRLFFRSLLRPERAVNAEYGLSPYVPIRLSYQAGIRPVFERLLYRPLLAGLLGTAGRARAIQSGSLRLYLGYIFATLVVLLVLAR